jgi:hypothetical protein
MNRLLTIIDRFIDDPVEWNDLKVVKGAEGLCRRILVGFDPELGEISEVCNSKHRKKFYFIFVPFEPARDNEEEPRGAENNYTLIEIYKRKHILRTTPQ